MAVAANGMHDTYTIEHTTPNAPPPNSTLAVKSTDHTHLRLLILYT